MPQFFKSKQIGVEKEKKNYWLMEKISKIDLFSSFINIIYTITYLKGFFGDQATWSH